MALKGKRRPGSGVRDLGCTLDELRIHLENHFATGMDWSNWGNGVGKWNIDHVVPLASVDLADREQFLRVCHYSNLRPLWWIENLHKGSREPNTVKNR